MAGSKRKQSIEYLGSILSFELNYRLPPETLVYYGPNVKLKFRQQPVSVYGEENEISVNCEEFLSHLEVRGFLASSILATQMDIKRIQDAG